MSKLVKQCETLPLRGEILIDNYDQYVVIGISAETLERVILGYFYDLDAIIFQYFDDIGDSINTKF